MPAIISFPFRKLANFLLRSLDYVLSNEQQINKVALAVLLVSGLATAEAQNGSVIQDADGPNSLAECLNTCSRIKTWYRTNLALHLLESCNQFCKGKWGLIQSETFRDF